MSTVRVRFAPSPTGSTHIGTARTALFNWLYARKVGGTFILRIEDTDRERNTQAALDELLSGLRWLGIDWDEGPEVGGPCGPYFQSRRGELYTQYLQILLDKGRAYEKDGAIFFKLIGERYTEYDEYLKAEVEKVRSAPVVINDIIRGRVERREERDFVISRSNGDPSFHFVNVVDDIAMKITHVLRGEDHLSNTSKHVELFNAFGITPPVYAHMPMILKDPSQGKGKMSKRDRGALIEEYQQRHFLPEAVVNFIALLGWSPKDGQEVLSISELVERFDIKDIQKAGARFDEKKMSYVNFEHMKRLPIERYLPPARAALAQTGLVDATTDEAYLASVLRICQEKINSFQDLPVFASYFFSESYANDEAVAAKLLSKPDAAARIQEAIPALASLATWTSASIEAALLQLAESKSLKVFAWFPLIRYAVSGVGGGPEFLPMLEVLGQERVVARLKRLRASL